jgi:hypothetical protein
MMEYINRRELAERIGKYVKPETPEEKELIEWCKDECIRQAYCMPFVDAVVVVRCRDCQHYIDGCCYVSNRTNKGLYPRVNIHSRDENDYCSYGERRTEE